jgi:DNA-directed RNA polymerase specialized sigma24 family protein
MEAPGRSFDEFYLEHFDRVARALVLAGAERELASDATQEAFARALRKWREVREMDRPDGWVYVVAMNYVRDRWRRAGRTEPADDGVTLDTTGGVLTRFLGHGAALAEYRRIFADQPALIANTRADVLPESFRVRLRDPAHATAWANGYRDRPQVDDVAAADAHPDPCGKP